MDMADRSFDNMSLTEVRALVETLEMRNEELTNMTIGELQEAGEFTTAQLALEDIGWRPLLGIGTDPNCFTLVSLRRISELCRALATVNPLVKRGLLVRTGYVWGSGVDIAPMEFSSKIGRPRTVNAEPELPPGLDDTLTGVLAQMEIERSAACDGNLFFLVDKKAKTVQRVPFFEVTDGISQRGNRERLVYIRRSWNDWDLDKFGNDLDAKPFTHPKNDQVLPRVEQPLDLQLQGGVGTISNVWYPTIWAGGDFKRTQLNGEAVDYSKVIVHVAFNRMAGWRWGVPDVLPAIWWTKAYKEFLENCAVLAKAYARFAWKVTTDKSKTVKRSASMLAQTPTRDPVNGMPLAIGGSVALGAGQDLTAIQRNTSVDFEAGRPLAAMIAAALDVPLQALTCDPGISNRSGAQSLDTSTILVMKARQKTMDEAICLIFKLLGLKVRLKWPEIDEEPIHRRLQAIDMGARLGTLTATETRAMVLDAWHGKWNEFPAQPPTPDELPLPLQYAPEIGTQPSKFGPAGSTGVVAPTGLKPGSTTGGPQGRPKQPSPMSRGDHELRDEGGQAHTQTKD